MTARVVQGRVRALARGGEGVVETDRGLVFVRGVLPGEEVRISLGKARRGAVRGKLVEVLSPSADRREPSCTLAAKCGGCPWMHASASLQKKSKLSFVRDACGDIDVSWHESEPLGYRRRARLAWRQGSIGYHADASNRVVDVERCIVLRPELQHAWSEARATLRDHLAGEGTILLSVAREGVAVALETDAPQTPSLFAACELLAASEAIAGVELTTSAGAAPARWGAPLQVVPAHDGTLEAPLRVFTQANDAVNQALVAEAVPLAEPDGVRVLELYSGIGNFTVPLAARAASLVAVEHDPIAVEVCRRHLEESGLCAKVLCADAGSPPAGRYDVVVLDPPRTGAREALNALLSMAHRPERIVYISCDTATLRRDIETLRAAGYRVSHAHAFDMFPQTAHVETLVRLVAA